MEFGREVYGAPGNATQTASFGPNQLIKQDAKLVTGWEDVIEELPTSIRAELLPVETATSEQRALLVEESLVPDELTCTIFLHKTHLAMWTSWPNVVA
jgi:DNA processing protein